jgi:hypothetical protein
MLALSDGQASGGRFIATGRDNTGSATYTFTVPTRGHYRLTARVQAPSAGHNSFTLRLNDGATEIWDITDLGYSWRTVDVSFRESGTPEAPARSEVVALLDAGTHRLTIEGREDDTKLDRIVLVKADSQPTGIKGAARMQRSPAAAGKARSQVHLRNPANAPGSFSARGRRVAPRNNGATGVRMLPPQEAADPQR